MGRKKLHVSNKERWGSIYHANFWAKVDDGEEEGNPLRQASSMLEQAVLNTAIQKGFATSFYCPFWGSSNLRVLQEPLGGLLESCVKISAAAIFQVKEISSRIFRLDLCIATDNMCRLFGKKKNRNTGFAHRQPRLARPRGGGEGGQLAGAPVRLSSSHATCTSLSRTHCSGFTETIPGASAMGIFLHPDPPSRPPRWEGQREQDSHLLLPELPAAGVQQGGGTRSSMQ